MGFHSHFSLYILQFKEVQHLNLSGSMEFIEDDLLIMELLYLSYWLASYCLKYQVIELYHYVLVVITVRILNERLFQVISHFHLYFDFDSDYLYLVSHLFHCWIYLKLLTELNF